jgi:hypothetical protein
MKNAVYWDIKTQFVPQRRHHLTATESSQLMLCKIRGLHNSDYEECRLLGCEHPVALIKLGFGRTFRLHHHGGKNPQSRNNVSSKYQLLVTETKRTATDIANPGYRVAVRMDTEVFEIVAESIFRICVGWGL